MIGFVTVIFASFDCMILPFDKRFFERSCLYLLLVGTLCIFNEVELTMFRAWRTRSKTRASVFIRGAKHRETDESTTAKAECFYCFEVFGSPDENRSTSF